MTAHNRTTDSLEETVTHVQGALSWPHFSLGAGHTSVDAIRQIARALPHHLGELPDTAQFDASMPVFLAELVGVAAGRVKGNQDLQVRQRGDGALDPLDVNGALPADCGDTPDRPFGISVTRRLLRKVGSPARRK